VRFKTRPLCRAIVGSFVEFRSVFEAGARVAANHRIEICLVVQSSNVVEQGGAGL
jgi:hypothetical protein